MLWLFYYTNTVFLRYHSLGPLPCTGHVVSGAQREQKVMSTAWDAGEGQTSSMPPGCAKLGSNFCFSVCMQNRQGTMMCMLGLTIPNSCVAQLENVAFF